MLCIYKLHKKLSAGAFDINQLQLMTIQEKEIIMK